MKQLKYKELDANANVEGHNLSGDPRMAALGM